MAARITSKITLKTNPATGKTRLAVVKTYASVSARIAATKKPKTRYGKA